MQQQTELIAFLSEWHDAVMGCEKVALDALATGDNDTYFAKMREKAERMERLKAEADPRLACLPEAVKNDASRQLTKFSNSARCGLMHNSPFWWSALLWNDDAKPGDTDNFQLFIDDLKARLGL